MPNVRNTPKRRRMECPRCQRDVAFTNPWVHNNGWGSGSLMRDTGTVLFSSHKTPEGEPCAVNGPHGFGHRLPVD